MWLHGAQSILNVTVNASRRGSLLVMTLPYHLQRSDAQTKKKMIYLQSRSGAKSGGPPKRFYAGTRHHTMPQVKHRTQKEKESPAPPNLAAINGAAHNKRRSDNSSEMQDIVPKKKVRKKTHRRSQHTPTASHHHSPALVIITRSCSNRR